MHECSDQPMRMLNLGLVLQMGLCFGIFLNWPGPCSRRGVRNFILSNQIGISIVFTHVKYFYSISHTRTARESLKKEKRFAGRTSIHDVNVMLK